MARDKDPIDHDRLFKELLTTFFSEFIDLFLPQVMAYLDPATLVAVDKEVFTDVTSGEKHEADIVMRAKFKGADTFFLVHVENQSSRDYSMGKRMFTYFARFHESYGLPVYPIVLFSYDKPLDVEPDRYEVVFPDKKVLEFSYAVIQLNRLNWRDYLNRPNPVASALMSKMQIAPPDRVKVKLECIRMLAGLKLNPARTQLISGFVGQYLRLNLVEAEKLDTNLAQAGLKDEEVKMSLDLSNLVTDWSELARYRTLVSINLRQLRHKFGADAIDGKLEQRIKNREIDQLENLSETLLDFTDVTDLEAWLKANPPAPYRNGEDLE